MFQQMQLPFESPVFTLCTIRFNNGSKFYILSTQCVHMVPEMCSITCMVFITDSKYVYGVVPTESYSVSFFIFKGLNRLHLHLQPYTNKPLLLQYDPSLVYINTRNEFFGYGNE